MTIVGTMDSGEGGMNPVAMTIINLRKEYWRSGGSNQRPVIESCTLLSFFCGICQRQCDYDFNMVFQKSCIVFCAKPKEVDLIKLISLCQKSISVALKYTCIFDNRVLK